MNNESGARGVGGEALLPCPFCGGPGRVFGAAEDWAVGCDWCDGASSGASRRNAIEKWNGRGKQASDPTPAPVAFRSRLKARTGRSDGWRYWDGVPVLHPDRRDEYEVEPLFGASPQAGASDPTPDLAAKLAEAEETIAQLTRALRAEVEGPSLTAQIDRHTLAAGECPPGSKVILVSSLKRLFTPPQAARAPLSPSEPLCRGFMVDDELFMSRSSAVQWAHENDSNVVEVEVYAAGLPLVASSAGPSNTAGADAPPEPRPLYFTRDIAGNYHLAEPQP